MPIGSVDRTSSYQETFQQSVLVVGGIFNPPVDFFTQGLADFLCLETLRHGTSWSNYVKIRMEGPDPTMGGGETGATYGHKVSKLSKDTDQRQDSWNRRSKGKFFVFLDSQAGHTTTFIHRDGEEKKATFTTLGWLYEQIHVRIAPATYGFGAGAACRPYPFLPAKLEVIWRFVSGVAGFFAPSVKLRFRPEDVDNFFQVDNLLPGRALFTAKKLSTDHLGLTGIFKQAVDGNILKRMQAKPAKCLWGAIRLINPVGMALLGAFGLYYASKKMGLMGREIGVLKTA